MSNIGEIRYNDAVYGWVRKGSRIHCDKLCHPSGKPIRFKSEDRMKSHVTTMRGKPLTHTHVKRISQQKGRKRRGAR